MVLSHHDLEDKGSKNSIVFTNTAIFFFPSLTLYFLGSLVNPNYSWCECKEISTDAITYSVLRGEHDSSVDIDAFEKCAEKTIDLMDFDLEPDQISADYISQVSYEICENGFYEGKGSNNRGKRYK